MEGGGGLHSAFHNQTSVRHKCRSASVTHTRVANCSIMMRSVRIAVAARFRGCRRVKPSLRPKFMRLLLRRLALVFFSSHAPCAPFLPFRMHSSAPAAQVICNVTPAAIATFPPHLTTCISNARDVSAAKLNDVSPIFPPYSPALAGWSRVTLFFRPSAATASR